MTVPAGYRLTSLEKDRADEMVGVVSWAFAFQLDLAAMVDVVPWDHARAAEVTDAARGEVGSLAGCHSSHTMTLRSPGGGTIQASGLTWVSVHPAHRRRGILSAMIDDHFSRALKRGECVSVLYAAETAIYQRFGYAQAAPKSTLDLGRAPRLREVAGSDDLTVRIETADLDAHAEIVRAVQRASSVPGTPVDFGDSVILDALLDVGIVLPNVEPNRMVIVEDPDGPRAFAMLKRTMAWETTGAAGAVEVQAWGAVDAASTRRLFAVVANLDLMAKCTVRAAGPDGALIQLLEDPRGVGRREHDGMWLRILDVPSALASRTYSADLDIVIEVSDALLPTNAGRWRLRAHADATPEIESTKAPCDLSLGIDVLSQALLGSTSLEAMHSVGRIDEHRPGAVREASRAFRSDIAPGCNLDF